MTTRRRVLELLASALLLTACDGPSVDPSTVITVHTTDHAGGPVAGVLVYGHDGAGAMVDQAVTDADGLAILSVPAGGSITTHEHDPQVPADVVTHHWSSVLGVEPGDNLEVPVDRGVALRRQVPVTVAALPPGATRFAASAPCAEASPAEAGQPATLWLDGRCPEHGPLVVTALGAGDVPVAYLELAQVDLAGPAIAATGTWVAPHERFAATVTGLPGGARLTRGTLADGYPVHWIDAVLTPVDGTATASGPRPALGDGVVHTVALDSGGFCDHRARRYTRSRLADVDSFAVELSALLPELTAVGLPDHGLRWTGGGDASVSGVSVHLEAALGTGDVVGQTRTWTVVAPPGTTSLTFPDDVGFAWPAGQGSGDRVTAVSVAEIASTHWSSYAQVRAEAALPPPRIAADFVTRTTSLTRQFAYLGCPSGP